MQSQRGGERDHRQTADPRRQHDAPKKLPARKLRLFRRPAPQHKPAKEDGRNHRAERDADHAVQRHGEADAQRQIAQRLGHALFHHAPFLTGHEKHSLENPMCQHERVIPEQKQLPDPEHFGGGIFHAGEQADKSIHVGKAQNVKRRRAKNAEAHAADEHLAERGGIAFCVQMRGGGRQHVGNLLGELAEHVTDFAAGLIWRDGGDAENGTDDRLIGFVAKHVTEHIEICKNAELASVQQCVFGK